MIRDVFGFYLIKYVCNKLIVFLYEVNGKCTECIKSVNLNRKQEVSPDEIMKYDEILQKINHYVVDEEHFLDKDINIITVARKCHINKMLVNKVLRFYYGLTISGYRKQLRLKYACRLLCDSPNEKIDVVASMSGFNTTRDFERCFVHAYHMSPSKYRRLCEYKKEFVLLTE